MKNALKFYLYFFPVFLLGLFWHKFQLPPINQIRQIAHSYRLLNIKQKEIKDVKFWSESKFTYTNYTKGVPLFLDRSFADEIGDKRLEGMQLIQIPRHYSNTFKLKIPSKFIVYRLLPANESGLKYSYSPTNIRVKVVGHSITHTRVVKKEFPAGTFSFAAGGPTAASPFLIYVEAFQNTYKPLSIINSTIKERY